MRGHMYLSAVYWLANLLVQNACPAYWLLERANVGITHLNTAVAMNGSSFPSVRSNCRSNNSYVHIGDATICPMKLSI